MGAVLREQNALPYEAWIMKNLTAKDDVDNVGAGRAAKGANPSACAKKTETKFCRLHFFVYRKFRRDSRGETHFTKNGTVTAYCNRPALLFSNI